MDFLFLVCCVSGYLNNPERTNKHNILTNQFKNRQDTGKDYRDMGQQLSKSRS